VAVKIIPKDRKSRDKKPAHNSMEKYYYGKDDPSKKSKRKYRYTRRATLQERVMREVHFTRYLHHPHIVSLLDFREDEKCFYLFYEYIDGAPLAAYIGRHGMVEKDAQRFFRQLASALEYCHRHCIVHRDVKVDVSSQVDSFLLTN
jgi:serine/threonine protein kinase